MDGSPAYNHESVMDGSPVYNHVSVMDGSPVYEDRIRFVWTTNDESNFYVDFLENKRVGSDAKATADRRQDNGTVEVQFFCH